MAIRNAADAQALLATAEGAMQEIHNIMLRQRELAVQASNGTTSTADNLALQNEVEALETENKSYCDRHDLGWNCTTRWYADKRSLYFKLVQTLDKLSHIRYQR